MNPTTPSLNSRKTLSWPLVALIFGLGVLIIIALAIKWRTSAFKVVVNGEGRQVTFEFEKQEVKLSELLDHIISRRDEGADDDKAEWRTVLGMLNSHGFYYIPSVEVVSAIRNLRETDDNRDVFKAFRQLLYNLEGPFSRPWTFTEAVDDRVLLALEDLDKHNPSNPLIARLWEMSLEWEGIFKPRPIKLSIQEDSTLKEGIASTCAGSILLDKAGVIVYKQNEDSHFIELLINKPRTCPATSSEDLLAGEGVRVWISLNDIRRLLKEETISREDSYDIELFLLPRSLSS